MLPHHSQSIQNVKEYFQRDPEVQALLLSGSIAHGFQNPASDVDVMIFVSEENYQKRFLPWSDNPYGWPAQFMLDSELNWMDGRTPVDDL
jgi:dTDP-4-dehydrorhamnose 3,5-epimerase-like enzyme